MTRLHGAVSLCALTGLLLAAHPPSAHAHGIAGDRVFPATLTFDDPAVADELALPTVQYLKDSDGVGGTSYSFEYAKTITPWLGISVESGWLQNTPGHSGFDNIETTLKWMLLNNAEHEFIFSVGLSIEWGGTGNSKVVDSYTTVSPNLYFGKGFGDLPDSLALLRPFAITGQLGYGLPTQLTDPLTFESNPRVLTWGLSLQYSLPYLNQNVREMTGQPDFIKQLTPIIEASFQSPVSNIGDGARITTGTINPGVIWSNGAVQVGLEALIPINAQSGSHVGVIGQLHFFLDDIFPNGIGKPLFP
ncbi:hypothetical protein [Xanthobacter aminoxidans]|uniref:hypothetical protein n=1 Tax=Xanthobacter aminoxidans TaxID=186280 RepID=UPI0037291EBD